MNSLHSRMQASLKSLENYLDKIEVLSAVSGKNCPVDKNSISALNQGFENLKQAFGRVQQAEILKEESDIQQAIKVFYGIHGLIRPEILATFVMLAKGYSLKFANQASEAEVVH